MYIFCHPAIFHKSYYLILFALHFEIPLDYIYVCTHMTFREYSRIIIPQKNYIQNRFKTLILQYVKYLEYIISRIRYL